MVLTLVVPDEYSYVLAAVTSTFFVNTVHMFRTSKLRKASGIKYPNAYASDEQAKKDPAAYTFNCAQRAHNNYTENQTSLIGGALIAGLRYPVPAAVLAATWAAGRVVYLFGYTSSAGPSGRVAGGIFASLSDVVLKCMAAYTVYKMIV
ncbi:hypothetical protein VHEMI10103 [[Torrubiella] hemipterigena]|uniref:Microsomal glutathione S-transferase 3 n=1 Tax=[Torrubiella] hemipterigena TaxID=1531966 RepID=A0A0A1TRJ8_9HYPO|nr:hypothetical protein VHEMI10103 [[Torrubiella] hemipterigena]